MELVLRAFLTGARWNLPMAQGAGDRVLRRQRQAFSRRSRGEPERGRIGRVARGGNPLRGPFLEDGRGGANGTVCVRLFLRAIMLSSNALCVNPECCDL